MIIHSISSESQKQCEQNKQEPCACRLEGGQYKEWQFSVIATMSNDFIFQTFSF